MNDDSETPFSFNPNEKVDNLEENVGDSCFNRNKKLIFFIIGGFLVVALIIVILIIIISKKKDEKNQSNEVILRSHNYLKAKYEVTQDKMKIKLYSQYSLPPYPLNYNRYIFSTIIDNTTNIKIDDGYHTFDKKGNYMVKICYISVICLSCLSGISLVMMYSTAGEWCYQRCKYV